MSQRINIAAYPPQFHIASQNLLSRQYSTAQQAYKKCLQYNPSSYSSYLNLAYINHLRRNYMQAVKLCDVAINIKPYSSQGYYNRCLALVAQGPARYEEASLDISAAISCWHLEAFKLQGDLTLLETAVAYSQNNIQALRFLVAMTRGIKREKYKQLITKYEDGYRISGCQQVRKTSAAAEQGLFRLNGKADYKNLQQLKLKINEYISLLKSDITNIERLKDNKIDRIKLQSCVYTQKVQPTSCSQSIIKYQQKKDQVQQEQEQEQEQTQEVQFMKINIRSSFSYQQQNSIMQRYSLNQQHEALKQESSSFLNIPSNNRHSLVESYKSPLKLLEASRKSNKNRHLQKSIYRFNGNQSFNNNVGSYISHSRLGKSRSILSSSRFCSHNGCTKCSRESQALPIVPIDGFKVQIKTIQIFRNQNIIHPKPYLIIYDGQNQHITQIDHQNGHFPKWNQIFYLKKDSTTPYRIELWHKDYKQKQDYLIGTTSFENKNGRVKCYFIKRHGGARKTGYIFLQLGQ